MSVDVGRGCETVRANTAVGTARVCLRGSGPGAPGRARGALGEAARGHKEPVWATIRWSGPYGQPRQCQGRTSVSEAAGSVKTPGGRAAPPPTGQLGRGGDVAPEHAAGVATPPPPSAIGDQGSSMSSTTRSTAGVGRVVRRSQRAAGPVAGGAPEKPRRSPGRWRRSPAAVRRRRPIPPQPDRAQEGAGQGAGPGAGLEDPGAGKDVARTMGGVLGIDDRAPRGIESTKSASSGRTAR